MNRRSSLMAGVLSVLASATVLAGNVASSIDSGGQRSTSANYTMDGSLGGIAGISTNVVSPLETAKSGYLGQLTEVVSLTATGTPATINQGATSQLSGVATILTGAMVWVAAQSASLEFRKPISPAWLE